MKKIVGVLFTAIFFFTLIGCTNTEKNPSRNSVSSEPPKISSSARGTPLSTVLSTDGNTAEPSPSDSMLILTEADIDKTAETLNIANKVITSFDFLNGCTNLKELTINNCKV